MKMEARVGIDGTAHRPACALPRETDIGKLEARVGIDGTAHRPACALPRETDIGKLEARVGIEPAYTELQSAA